MMKTYFKSNSIQLFHDDCINVLNNLPQNSVDMIFADPPYFLSNGDISCKAGKMVSVNKAEWDQSKGFLKNIMF